MRPKMYLKFSLFWSLVSMFNKYLTKSIYRVQTISIYRNYKCWDLIGISHFIILIHFSIHQSSLMDLSQSCHFQLLSESVLHSNNNQSATTTNFHKSSQLPQLEINKQFQVHNSFPQLINAQHSDNIQQSHLERFYQTLNCLKENSPLQKYISRIALNSNSSQPFLYSIGQYLSANYKLFQPQTINDSQKQPNRLQVQTNQKLFKSNSQNPFCKKTQPSQFINYPTYISLLSAFRSFSLNLFLQLYSATQYASIPNLNLAQIIYDHRQNKFYLDFNQLKIEISEKNPQQKSYLIDFELTTQELNQISTKIYQKFYSINTSPNQISHHLSIHAHYIIQHAFSQNQKNKNISQNTRKILETSFFKKITQLYSQKSEQPPQITLKPNQGGQPGEQFKIHCQNQKHNKKLSQFIKSVQQQIPLKIICFNFIRLNWQFKRLILKYSNFPQINPQNYACLTQCNNTIDESQLFDEIINKSYKTMVEFSLKNDSRQLNEFEIENKNIQKENLQVEGLKKKKSKSQCDSFSDLSQDREQWQDINEVQFNVNQNENEIENEKQKFQQLKKKKFNFLEKSVICEKQNIGKENEMDRIQIQDISLLQESFADLGEESDNKSQNSSFSQLSSNNSKKGNQSKKKKQNKDLNSRNEKKKSFQFEKLIVEENLSTMKELNDQMVKQNFEQQKDFSLQEQKDNKSYKSCPSRYFSNHECKDKKMKLFEMCMNEPYVLEAICLEILDEPGLASEFKRVKQQKQVNIFTLAKNLCMKESRVKRLQELRKYMIHLFQFEVEFISQMTSSDNTALVSVWNCVRFIVLNLFAHLVKQIMMKVTEELNEMHFRQSSVKMVYDYMQNEDHRWEEYQGKLTLALELSYQKILNYLEELNNPDVTQKRSNVKKIKLIIEKDSELMNLLKDLNLAKINTEKYDYDLTANLYQKILKILKKEMFSSTVIERFYKKVKKTNGINDLYGEALFGKKQNVEKAKKQFCVFLLQLTKCWNLIVFLPYYSFQNQLEHVKRIKEKGRLRLNKFRIQEVIRNLDTIYIYERMRMGSEMLKKKREDLPDVTDYYMRMFIVGRDFFGLSSEEKERITNMKNKEIKEVNQRNKKKQKRLTSRHQHKYGYSDDDSQQDQDQKTDMELHRDRVCIFDHMEMGRFSQIVRKVYFGGREEFFLSQNVLRKLMNI